MLTLNYRYRLYPDSTQQETLSEWLEVCRGAYNYALREIKDWGYSRRCAIDRCSLASEYILPADLKFPGEVQQLNALPRAKQDFPRLSEVPSQVLQQVVKQLHRGWEGFQRRGFGFPRFKKFGQLKSLLFPQFKANPVSGVHTELALLGETPRPQFLINLPKIGAIAINLHRPIPDGFVVKQVRLLKKADRWYAVLNIQCDVDIPAPLPSGYPIGVDVGLEKFLATSDGLLVKPPKFFKSMQSKLQLLQRRLSRKQRRSQNYEKAGLKVAKMHHDIDNTRKNYHYKQAHALCDAGNMLFMEDLDYRVSAKGMLGKQMLDAAFGQFRSITQYVCWRRGKFFGVVEAWGTSQECPECGARVAKDLSVRVHQCSQCGYTTDRDVASAQVIRNRGVSTPGLGGRETACAEGLAGIGVTQSSQVSQSRKGITRKASK